jgi:hypothetical protein
MQRALTRLQLCRYWYLCTCNARTFVLVTSTNVQILTLTPAERLYYLTYLLQRAHTRLVLSYLSTN